MTLDLRAQCCGKVSGWGFMLRFAAVITVLTWMLTSSTSLLPIDIARSFGFLGLIPNFVPFCAALVVGKFLGFNMPFFECVFLVCVFLQWFGIGYFPMAWCRKRALRRG